MEEASASGAGPDTGFDELVLRYREQVLRLVLAVLGSELAMDGEDVVQQVFMTVHDRLGSFRGESRVSTWLYRIAHNRALEHKRKVTRRRQLLSGQVLSPRSAAASDSPASERLLAGERSRTVRRALDRLPQTYQTALRLHYWFGLSVEEIADTMGAAAGTVKSHLHRGRRRLHRLLNAEGLTG